MTTPEDVERLMDGESDDPIGAARGIWNGCLFSLALIAGVLLVIAVLRGML